MRQLKTIIVHWCDSPPEHAVIRRSGTHFYSPFQRRSYILWRQRWCIVNDECVEEFNRLDEWLRNADHGFLFEKNPCP